MTKNKIFIFFNIFLLLWIFINNILENITTSLLVLLILVVLFLLFCFYTKKYFLLTFFIFLWFLLWVIISNFNLVKINNNFININTYLGNEKFYIEYEIKEISKIDSEKIIYKVKILKINNILLTEKIYAQSIIKNLDRIEKWTVLSSKEKMYKIKSTEDFQYDKYLLSKWIYFKFFPYSYTIITKNKLNRLELKIIEFRTKLLNTINEIYTNQEAIFLWWILLWAREEINDDLKTNFNNSWLTHFIAVSGFNITILLVFFGLFLKYFPSSIRVILMTFFIIVFVILVWDTAPVIRAAIMWLIWYYVLSFWRNWNILSILLLTATLMSIYSPYSLNYDISMHLSFLAVLGIIYTQDFYEKSFKFLPNILEIRTAFTLTLSALTFSLPIIIFSFWQMSLLSPLANVLVAWTIPLAMLIWFLSTIVYLVFPMIWIIVWYFAWILLKWDICIVNTFGQISWAILKFEEIDYKWYFQIIYFITLIFILIYFRKKEDNI